MDENLDLSKNLEIQKALEEFEKKNISQTIEQDTSTGDTSKVYGMAGLLIKHSGGLIKNERQAQYALLIIALLFFALSMYLFFG